MLQMAENPPPASIFREEVERLRASGVLGRSTQLQRLFDFLVRCHEEGRVPKELEVAVGAFGRASGFDVGQDALVRVHAHKLRRRLEAHYRDAVPSQAWRLAVPRGEYRLALESEPEVEVAGAASELARRPARERLAWGLCGLLALFLALLLWREWREPRPDERSRAAQASALWAPLFADDLPIQVVLGDYYIFGERGAMGQVDRLIRDFEVNSRRDLEQRFIDDPSLTSHYADLNLGYLPTSSAQALRQVLPVVIASGKPVSLTLASELDPASLKSSHIVYVGYLSALGMLQDIAFAGSRYSFGGSYDELIDAESGQTWSSEAGTPHRDAERYRDYAYVSSFSGPGGLAHLLITGTRDTGLMQAAENAADPAQLSQLSGAAKPGAPFEALYEVHGVNGTNVESRLLNASPLQAGDVPPQE